MRIIILILGLAVMSCNNSSRPKPDNDDKAGKTDPPPDEKNKTDTVFHALGTEPFWVLDVIGDSKIVFHPAGGPDVEVPFVSPAVMNDTTTYQSAAGTNSVELRIIKKGCSDGMSDQLYPCQVKLRVNEKKFSGCGYADPLF